MKVAYKLLMLSLVAVSPSEGMEEKVLTGDKALLMHFMKDYSSLRRDTITLLDKIVSMPNEGDRRANAEAIKKDLANFERKIINQTLSSEERWNRIRESMQLSVINALEFVCKYIHAPDAKDEITQDLKGGGPYFQAFCDIYKAKRHNQPLPQDSLVILENRPEGMANFKFPFDSSAVQRIINFKNEHKINDHELDLNPALIEDLNNLYLMYYDERMDKIYGPSPTPRKHDPDLARKIVSNLPK